VVDAQSGHEKTITGMLPALAGANVIYGLGMLEMGITFDLAQLVLDNEIAGMILYSLNGIVVNDETLSVDVIRELGIGKDYMAHASTYKHMKSQSQVQIIDRRMREDWEAAGSTDIYKRAHDKMINILETYEPSPLPDNVRDTLRSIVEEAEKELVP
jgi:trimethylamine--corrinoid protein Co-methyltransferase